MSEPVFYLQISDDHGSVIRLPGGGALETALIGHFLQHIRKRPIGLFRTEKQVAEAIEAGIRDAILELKLKTTVVAR